MTEGILRPQSPCNLPRLRLVWETSTPKARQRALGVVDLLKRVGTTHAVPTLRDYFLFPLL